MKKTILTLFITGTLMLSACSFGKDSYSDSGMSRVAEDGETLGEGEKSFSLIVTDAEGETESFTIKTDEKTVGAALCELDFIGGKDSQYGMYVKTVNGITLDFDADHKYWAFYINGEYAQYSVDMTDIDEDAEYAFTAE